MVATAKFRPERHQCGLHTSTMVTRWFYQMYRPGGIIIDAEKVVTVLSEAGVSFVLVGTHGIGGWRSQARATQDIDILAKKDHALAVRSVQAAFPKLLVEDGDNGTKFNDPQTGEQRIDLMKPVQKVYQLAFRQAQWVGRSHRVPDLEMALLLKFAARISPHRRSTKRMQDTADFADIVEHNQADIDLPKLGRLADQVYDGGRSEIVKLVEDILAGRPIVI